MSRLRWFPFSPKSVVRRILAVSVDPLNGRFSQFQMGFIHSSNSPRMCQYARKHTEFAPKGLLLSKRYIHATGSHLAMKHDYYEVLGISEDATRDEIKKAFHALAKKYHPDANKNNPSAKRKFQEIRDAYEILQDPEKRAQYDRVRKSSGSNENAGYSDSDRDHFRYTHGSQFSDSFRTIFSEIFENEAKTMNGDIQVELLLEFSEAANGCTKSLSFDADMPCESCNGRGYPLYAASRTCPVCNGIGRVSIPPFTTTCGTCKGFGQIIKDYCIACKGSGVCGGVKDVKVTIPEGVDSGDIIRVPKAGNFGGLGRQPGDLIIRLKVADHPIFSRQGADIYVDSRISFTQAILGGSVEVPTLTGKVKVRIPKGVQHGQLVLVRGKGLPKSGFLVDRGDQYVRVCIKFPSTITERQRAILEELEKEIIDDNDRSAEGSWWQHWVGHLSGSKLILELSILMLLFLFLGKVLN